MNPFPGQYIQTFQYTNGYIQPFQPIPPVQPIYYPQPVVAPTVPAISTIPTISTISAIPTIGYQPYGLPLYSQINTANLQVAHPHTLIPALLKRECSGCTTGRVGYSGYICPICYDFCLCENCYFRIGSSQFFNTGCHPH